MNNSSTEVASLLVKQKKYPGGNRAARRAPAKLLIDPLTWPGACTAPGANDAPETLVRGGILTCWACMLIGAPALLVFQYPELVALRYIRYPVAVVATRWYLEPSAAGMAD